MAIEQENIETIAKDLDAQLTSLALYLGVSREDLGEATITPTVHKLEPHLDLELSYKIEHAPVTLGANTYQDLDTAFEDLNRIKSQYDELSWHDATSTTFLDKTEPSEDPSFQNLAANYQHDCGVCDAYGNYQCNNCNGHGRTRCRNCDHDGEVLCHYCGYSGRQRCLSCGGGGKREEVTINNIHGQMVRQTRVAACYGCGGTGYQGNCKACQGTKHITCGSCGGGKYFSCRPCNQTGRIQCGNCNATGTAVSGLALTASLKATPSFNLSPDDTLLNTYMEHFRAEFLGQPDVSETRTSLVKLSPRKARATFSVEALTAEAEVQSRNKWLGSSLWKIHKAGRHVKAPYTNGAQHLNWKLISSKVEQHDYDALRKFPAGRDILENFLASKGQRSGSASWERLTVALGSSFSSAIESLAEQVRDEMCKGERRRAVWLFFFVALLGSLMQFTPLLTLAIEKLGPYGFSTLNQYTGFLAISAWLLTVVHIEKKRKRRLKRMEAITGSWPTNMGRAPLRAWRTLLAASFVFFVGSASFPAFVASAACENNNMSEWAACAGRLTMTPYLSWKLGLEHGLHGDLSTIAQFGAETPPTD